MTTQFIGQKPTFTALPNWLRSKATPLEGWILWCLQSHYPNIHPSMTLLAQEACISRRSVSAVLAGMERKGWLVRERSFSEQGRKLSNRYRLTIWDPHWAIPDRAPDALGQEMPYLPRAGDALGIGQEMHMDRAGDALGIGQEMPIKKNKKRRSREEDQEKKEKPPFIPPSGERRDERGGTHPYPDQVEIFGMDSQGSEQAQAQPQPQQPVKPWEPAPPTPDPEPQPEPLAEAPVKPRARKRKQVFEPTEGDIPARLLPVASELLQFWPTRSGVMSREAWELLLTNACKIQNHPDGGTEIVRQQLQEGIETKTEAGKGWRSLRYDNWLKYGTKATTPIMGTGFNRKPTQVESTTAAIAFLNARDAQRAAYANQPAQTQTQAQAESAQYILAEAV